MCVCVCVFEREVFYESRVLTCIEQQAELASPSDTLRLQRIARHPPPLYFWKDRGINNEYAN